MDDFERSLLANYYGLYRYALSMARNSTVAEDLVQDTMARALEKREQFRSGTDLRCWIRAILRNRFLNDLRRDKQKNKVVDAYIQSELVLMAEAGPSQEVALELNNVLRALDRIAPALRDTLLLSIEYPYEELAHIVGVDVSTIKTRVYRARRALACQMN